MSTTERIDPALDSLPARRDRPGRRGTDGGRAGRAWGYGDDLDVGVTGDAPAVADAVRWWAGADTVVLDPTRDDPDPEGFVRFVAQRVRPLV
jgi:hypothetical protein